MQALFYVGLIFVLGAITEWLSPKLHIPRVVGYLILGLIIGPEVFAIIPKEFVENSSSIIDLALSVISVLVGATLKISSLKKHAKEVLNITIFQSLGTFIIVSLGFICVGGMFNLNTQEVFLLAIFLGAIASATDTAAPIAIVHETKAKGEFTSTFLAIIAVDDAISLMVFSLALTIGITLTQNGIFQTANIYEALFLIIFSSLLGIITATINNLLEKLLAKHKGMETIATIGLVFITYALSQHWELEPLLSAMVMGIVMTNSSNEFDLVHEEIDAHLIEIIFMLFFVLSAMHLNFHSITSIFWAIALYVLFRLLGKFIGSYIGASISHSSNEVKKYMGFALIPQAGVAIGLALALQEEPAFKNIADIVLNIVIATTLIHELIGPILTKYILQKVGEVPSTSC